MPLSPASLMQAEIRKFWETRESSPSDYRGQRQPDEDVREYATPRRAQLKASDRISGHFGEGGALDSQTSDTQYFDRLVAECTDDLPTDSAHDIKAHAEPSACEHKREPSTERTHGAFDHNHEPSTESVDPSVPTTAQLQVELAQTRRQLYEYCGRWVLAEMHIQELEDTFAPVPQASTLPAVSSIRLEAALQKSSMRKRTTTDRGGDHLDSELRARKLRR